MRYAVYLIKKSWQQVDQVYSTSSGSGHEINNAHFCASFWNQEDKNRGHQYEVREWK